MVKREMVSKPGCGSAQHSNTQGTDIRQNVWELAVEETAEGILLPVRAQPGARKNGVTGTHDGRLKVAVTQAPEKGKANAALQKVIAAELGLKKSQVRLVTGPSASHKRFLIVGLAVDELRKRIENLLRK